MIELLSGALSVVVDPESGGRLASMVIAGRERLVTQQSAIHQMLGWGCYPMVPWAGRVRRGSFRFDQRRYQLPLRLPPHAIHGTVVDHVWAVDHATTTSVQMHTDLGPHWPWAGTVTQSIEVEDTADGGCLRSRLEVAGEGEFPAQVGWHPWFTDNNRPPRLSFAAHAMYRRDSAGIPTGEMVSPGAHPWDDCFVGVVDPPTLIFSDGLQLSVWSDCDHWVVYEPDHAVCVEPQSGPPDGFTLQPHTVTPGSPLSRTMLITWRHA